MFTNQDSLVIQQENKRFYDLQREFVESRGIPFKKNEYLNNEFFQHIVVSYQKDRSKENGWLFGKALDILIRNNITSKSFIQYNEETKQDFYSNAMYRCCNYTINTFNPEMNAFIYFTSTIKNSFKEELNEANKQRSLARKEYQEKGLDSIMYNVDTKNKEELHQEYILDKAHEARLEDIPMFIKEVYIRYKDYKITPITLVEDDTVHRFQRKHQKYNTFLQISKGVGIVIEYINLQRVNENEGMYSKYLQKRALVARKNGHQCFFLYSDIWNDKDIPDETIFEKLDTLIRLTKENVNYNSGKDLMLDYIPYSMIEEFGVTEPIWYLLDPNKDTRHISLQNLEEYIEIKNKNKDYTRTFNAGYLKV